jgi:hypothetical protein
MNRPLVLICFLLFSATVIGQPYRSDSVFYSAAFSNAVDKFHQFRGDQSDLYNGIQFIGYPKIVNGFPFFNSDNWETGTVLYDSILYSNINLKYELVKDQVVVRHPGDMNMILLFSPRIKSFTLGDKYFVYINQDDRNMLHTGFYQLLYKGPISVFAKRVKIISETITDMHLDQRFTETDRYYIEKEGVYYNVHNAKTILSLVKDHKKEIQQFLRRNKLKYKKDPELTLVKAAEFYHQISN